MRKLILYLCWLFDRTELKTVTFEAYQDKLKVDEERKKAGQLPLKDRIKDYRKAGREKKNYNRLFKILGKDFMKLTHTQRMFMARTAGIIKLPWIGRLYTNKDFTYEKVK